MTAYNVRRDRDSCVLVNQMNAVHCRTCRNETYRIVRDTHFIDNVLLAVMLLLLLRSEGDNLKFAVGISEFVVFIITAALH